MDPLGASLIMPLSDGPRRAASCAPLRGAICADGPAFTAALSLRCSANGKPDCDIIESSIDLVSAEYFVTVRGFGIMLRCKREVGTGQGSAPAARTRAEYRTFCSNGSLRLLSPLFGKRGAVATGQQEALQCTQHLPRALPWRRRRRRLPAAPMPSTSNS